MRGTIVHLWAWLVAVPMALALAGCEGWNLGAPRPEAAATADTAGLARLRAVLPASLDDSAAALLGNAGGGGRRFVLGVWDAQGGDTLVRTGTLGR